MPQDGETTTLAIPSSPAPANAFLKPFGRPSTYTPEIGAKICELIAQGWKMRQIEQRDDMPEKGQIYSWLKQHSEFNDQWLRAREHSVEALAEEAIDVVDNCEDVIYHDGRPIPNNAAVKKADTRVRLNQWLMGKWSKRYADKQTIDMNITGNIELSAKIDNAIKRLEATTIDITADTVSSTQANQLIDKSSK